MEWWYSKSLFALLIQIELGANDIEHTPHLPFFSTSDNDREPILSCSFPMLYYEFMMFYFLFFFRLFSKESRDKR